MPEPLAPEVRFRRVREMLLALEARSAAGMELVKINAEVTALEDQYLKTLQNAEQHVGRIRQLEEDIKKLGKPPLLHAILIGRSPRGADTYVVSVGGQRFDVNFAPPDGADVQPEDLLEGQEVLLRRETNAIVGVVGPGRRGESAEVRDVLRDPGTGDVDRLLVRSGSSEAIVVEIAERLRKLPEEAEDAQARRPKAGDFVLVDSAARIAFETLPMHETSELELEKDPEARFEDIAGLEDKIQMIREAIEMPYLYRREFEEYGLERPRGILLHGPPGCGKTMIGKAVANGLKASIISQIESVIERIRSCEDLPPQQAEARWQEIRKEAPSAMRLDSSHRREAVQRLEATKKEVRSYFLNIKGPELLSKWVGEAEHRIRQIFLEAKRKASYTAPVIVFFDEIESMFQRRGTGVSSDMEKTMVPQLLTELDGVEELENVVLIGASNRHELLDPALMRPGRLDIKIRIDRPDRAASAAIFQKYLPGAKLCDEGMTEVASADFSREVTSALARLRDGDSYLVLESGRTLPAVASLGSVLAGDVQLEVVERICAYGEMRDCDGNGYRRLTYEDLARAIEEVCQRRRTDLVLSGRLPDVAGGVRVVLGLGAAERALKGQVLPSFPIPPAALDAAGSSRLSQILSDMAVETLFSSHSFLRARILAPCGQEHIFLLRDFVSGALIANVVSRAKRLAVKRQAIRLGPCGLTADDLLSSIRAEYEENKDQLISNMPEIGESLCVVCKRRHASADEYEISVMLGRNSRDPWHVLRRPPYTRGAGAVAR